MNLIITAAGNGSRFKEKGFTFPKPLIYFKNKPLFWWSVESAKSSKLFNKIFFVVLKEHVLKFKIEQEIKKIYPNSTVIIIDQVTSGAAETAYIATDHINNNDPLAFLDCDLAFDFSFFLETNFFQNSDAKLCAFKSNKPNYSYIRFDDKDHVIETVEKKVISNFAIAGLYFFKDKNIYKESYMKYVTNNNYDELFMSGIFNVLIKNKKKIDVIYLNKHISLGTPEELMFANKDNFVLNWQNDN